MGDAPLQRRIFEGMLPKVQWKKSGRSGWSYSSNEANDVILSLLREIRTMGSNWGHGA